MKFNACGCQFCMLNNAYETLDTMAPNALSLLEINAWMTIVTVGHLDLIVLVQSEYET